jgi:hypothetical protein
MNEPKTLTCVTVENLMKMQGDMIMNGEGYVEKTIVPNPEYYRRRPPSEKPSDMADVVFGFSETSHLWKAGYYQEGEAEDDNGFISGEDGYSPEEIKWWSYCYIPEERHEI